MTRRSTIYVKFDFDNKFDNLYFLGSSISLRELKLRVKELLEGKKKNSISNIDSSSRKRGKKLIEDEILIYDADGIVPLTNDFAHVKADSRIIVRRNYGTADKNQCINDSLYQDQKSCLLNDVPEFVQKFYAMYDIHFMPFEQIQKTLRNPRYFLTRLVDFQVLDELITRKELPPSLQIAQFSQDSSNWQPFLQAQRNEQDCVLFFSVNRTLKIQGCARLVFERISNDKNAPYSCKLEWLRICDVDISRIVAYKKESLTSSIAKFDKLSCQEISQELGLILLNQFKRPDGWYVNKNLQEKSIISHGGSPMIEEKPTDNLHDSDLQLEVEEGATDSTAETSEKSENAQGKLSPLVQSILEEEPIEESKTKETYLIHPQNFPVDKPAPPTTTKISNQSNSFKNLFNNYTSFNKPGSTLPIKVPFQGQFQVPNKVLLTPKSNNDIENQAFHPSRARRLWNRTARSERSRSRGLSMSRSRKVLAQ